jgi:hypothetical protein
MHVQSRTMQTLRSSTTRPIRSRRATIGRIVAAAAISIVATAGCGSRVETTASTPSTVAPVATTTAAPGKASTTVAGAPTTTASGATPTTTTPPTTVAAGATTTAPPAGEDLTDFCEKTKLLDLSNVTAFEVYDANAAVKMVFTFDKIQKAAPTELADGFKKMRPLVEELNKKVKSGEVHDRDSLQAWLVGLNESNQAALEQWVQGQATVVPFIKEHCP